MRVHVDEPGDDGLAGAVHGLVRDQTVRLREGEDPADVVPVDEKVDRGSVQLYVPEKDHG